MAIEKGINDFQKNIENILSPSNLSEDYNRITDNLLILEDKRNGTPINETSPIDLEIFMSESLVESRKNGFILKGNSMNLKLDGEEYTTLPDGINYLLVNFHQPNNGFGIIRRHFSGDYHTIEQGAMIRDKLIGDLVLSFKSKSTKKKNSEDSGEDKTEYVYVVLPIFKAEQSNRNGMEIIKLSDGIVNGIQKESEKKNKVEKEREAKKNDLGFQISNSRFMSTNGFKDFETVNLTDMIKPEVPIIKYKMNNTTFLIFLNSSINVSKHTIVGKFLPGSVIASSKAPSDVKPTITYYENGIEVAQSKSLNCQPISDRGQVIKEINKGAFGEKKEMDFIEQLETLTQTTPGLILFGVLSTIFIYLVVFSSMHILYNIGKYGNKGIKVARQEFYGVKKGSVSDALAASKTRGSLKPQNKGKTK